MARPAQRTRELIELLSDAGVRFVIVGGVAAYLHGSARPTDDLDVAFEFSEDNVSRLLGALAGLHPRHATVPGLKPIDESAGTLATYRNLYVLCDLGRLDLLGELPPVGRYADVARAAVQMEAHGRRAAVIGLDDLIAIKESLPRAKDRLAAIELKAIRERKARDPATASRLRSDYLSVPCDLPIPVDDGACDHLPGMRIPAVALASTSGGMVDVAGAARGLAVFFFYPRTGRPDEAAPAHWDEIPGARGCTPQSCGFRDVHAEFGALGAGVFGVSTMPIAHVCEFAERMGMTMEHLADERFALVDALGLPTFAYGGRRMVKRLAIVAEGGVISKVFYPVFPPDRNAGEVLGWLRGRG